MMPPSVAYLINQYPSVSHTFIRREIAALERRGHEVHRIALRGWDGHLLDKADLEERTRTRYVLRNGLGGLARAVMSIAFSSPMRLALAARLAWQMARGSDRPLLVHFAYLAEACVIRTWLRAAGVSHLHAHFATNPAEVAMLVNALGGPPYSFTAHGSDIMDRPAQIGLDLTLGRAAFVCAVCSFGASQIYKWTRYQLWFKVKVVRCGLERGYGASADGAPGRSRRFVCVGRLSQEKGQMLLIRAAALLARQMMDFEIVLAGDGPMRPQIEALIDQHGLAHSVRIAGWLDAEGIAAELREARALVVPSLSEGLPVVIMEAMAHRLPVIAPFLAGIPELVADQRTGWLFPAGDAEALAGAMGDCLRSDAALLTLMGEKALESVWKAHDVDVEAEKLAKLIASPPQADSLT